MSLQPGALLLFLFEQPNKPGKNRIVFFMPSRHQKKTILVVSLSPEQADVRKRVLEAAGYRVIAAKTVVKVIATCETRRVDLAMIGYSLPPAEKRRVWSEIRSRCKIPILELYQGRTAELMEDGVHVHNSLSPEDFMHAVKRILGEP